MGMSLLQLPDDLEKRRQQWLWDDFFSYLDTFTWTKGSSGAGAVVIGSGPATQLKLTSGTTANGEAWVASTNKFWQFLANKPLITEARINAQEANTNNLSIFVGYSSAFATGLVTAANPNAFLATTNSSVGFFLSAGSTNWSVVESIGTTQQIIATAEAAVPASDQVLRVEVKPVGTNIEVDFLVGNADTTGGADSAFPVGFQMARETASGYLKPIKIRAALASAVQMGVGVYIRGMSTTSETLLLDYLGALSLR
jgi:hypothetical protein